MQANVEPFDKLRVTFVNQNIYWRESQLNEKEINKMSEYCHCDFGNAILVHLPEIGIKGNTHFPFSDLNNVQVDSVRLDVIHLLI